MLSGDDRSHPIDKHKMERSTGYYSILIHDNDCSFCRAFDAVFESEGISIIHTPFQAPNVNAHAERWVRTVREECLDYILIINAKVFSFASGRSRGGFSQAQSIFASNSVNQTR